MRLRPRTATLQSINLKEIALDHEGKDIYVFELGCGHKVQAQGGRKFEAYLNAYADDTLTPCDLCNAGLPKAGD